ncbi:MAG: hypothetical protein DRQ89_12475 [Epsilonproteobacteria bacterium]|nr:MAG: hypothetical protein DRQ89_12475 [Campylobacterota bacterium]
MAAPAYSEDLTDIDLAESGSTGVAVNYSGGGGAAPAFGADLGMQGGGCWDRQVSAHERGVVFNQSPGAGAVATGVHIFQWGFVATPGITDNLATRGAYLICGTGTNATVQFHVEGNDTYGAAGRVGRCYSYRYVTTANTGSVPYRTVNGSPGATPTYFGFGIKTTASAKGANMGCDAVRYGTGAYLTAGDSGDPATFDGFATQNDLIGNRWGILTNVGGSYELQGYFVIGQNNSKTATLAYFDDSDVNILIADTPHTEDDFTRILIDHASTEVYWNNISITALGTNNPGLFSVLDSSATVEITGGTWTGLGTATFSVGCVCTGVTFRGCDFTFANSASFVGCTWAKASNISAVSSSDLSQLDGCDFISDGTGYAVSISGTISSDVAMSWNCTDSGYAATNGNTGNETIGCSVDSGKTLTINVGSGGSTPTIRNLGLGTVTVVSSKTLTLTDIPTGVQVTIVNSSTRTELQNSTSTGADITYGHSGGETVDILLMHNSYDPNASDIYDLTLPSSDSSIKFSMTDDLNFDNP